MSMIFENRRHFMTDEVLTSLFYFVAQTYASFMRCFGFGLLNFRMWSSKSAKGVSLKTLELYALTFLVRLLSIMRHQGYLPYDKSGDWFYHTVSRHSSSQFDVDIFEQFN